MKNKMTKLMANTALSVLFLALIALPLSTMGALKVEQKSQVLSAQDTRSTEIYEKKLKRYEELILSQQEEIENLQRIIRNLTEQLNEEPVQPITEEE